MPAWLPSKFKIVLAALTGVAISSVFAVLFIMYRQIAELASDLKAARAEIVMWEQKAQHDLAAIKGLQALQNQAAEEAKQLKETLSSHDLSALSSAKPGLIERRINRGTADAFRLLELATQPQSESPASLASPRAGKP